LGLRAPTATHLAQTFAYAFADGVPSCGLDLVALRHRLSVAPA
jgi:hypothetical protein